jgi:hypothetical protein
MIAIGVKKVGEDRTVRHTERDHRRTRGLQRLGRAAPGTPPTGETRRPAGKRRHPWHPRVVSRIRQTSPGPRCCTPGELTLRLPFRRPMCPDDVVGRLAADAVPGVEEWRDGAYRRTLRLPHGHGIVELTPPRRDDAHVGCRLSLPDFRDLAFAISRCRRLLDLDADPVAVGEHLSTDPMLAPRSRTPRGADGRPGRARPARGPG